MAPAFRGANIKKVVVQPINTFQQAKEYRNRYLANLSLEVQNDLYNLRANQVFKQTGQPSVPPDTRSTTEKLADVERVRVDLLRGFLQITDGIQASDALSKLTTDEILFASQKLPLMIADIKPKYARGIPADALVAYIKALRNKEMATNGVSFTAQEATAQAILQALQNGQRVMGASAGPFDTNIPPPPPPSSSSSGQPIEIPSMLEPSAPPAQRSLADIFGQRRAAPEPVAEPAVEETYQDTMKRVQKEKDTRAAEMWLANPSLPLSQMPKGVQAEVARIKKERGEATSSGASEFIQVKQRMDSDPQIAKLLSRNFNDISEWTYFPMANLDMLGYPVDNDTSFYFLKKWITSPERAELVRLAGDDWKKKRTVNTLKKFLTPFMEQFIDITSGQRREDIMMKMTAEPVMREASLGERTRQKVKSTGEMLAEARARKEAGSSKASPIMTPDELLAAMEAEMKKTNKGSFKVGQRRPTPATEEMRYAPPSGITRTVTEGFGVKPRVIISRPREPPSRMPRGREILGYGLKKSTTKPKQNIELNYELGIQPAQLISFGKYMINPSKLAAGVLDIKSVNGHGIAKYPSKGLSPKLTKVMRRMLDNNMPDASDFNEMDIEDQKFLYNLAKDSNIMDRLDIPTPKMTKDGEEEYRFEVLKGQIMAGNDSKELVKEFKQLLLRFSNDGRLKKSEAREILLDLVSMGY